jgi:hypothetical protein
MGPLWSMILLITAAVALNLGLVQAHTDAKSKALSNLLVG